MSIDILIFQYLFFAGQDREKKNPGNGRKACVAGGSGNASCPDKLISGVDGKTQQSMRRDAFAVVAAMR